MDERFDALKNDRVIKNKRGRQWVDVPKDAEDDSDVDSEEYNDQFIESDTSSHEEDSDSNSNDLDFINLTKDAATVEDSTKRLAVLHFDFDEFTLEYLSMVIKSSMPKDGKIKSITRYPTEEYMERIDDDIKFGPKEFRIEDYDGKECDEAGSDSEELNKANVKFAISRLKFFVVVFEFNSTETSDAVYNSLDGTNLGDSGLKLDLRFVPEDKTFVIPDEYINLVQTLRPNSTKFKNTGFQPSCFVQTKCKKTWDETPLDRQMFCEKAFAQSDCDLSDVEDYCGGATDSEFSASDAESDFYTTIDGPTIPKYRKKRIPANDFRELYGLNTTGDAVSESEEEYENDDDDEEEVVANIDSSDDDFVVDETAECDSNKSDSSDDEDIKEKDKKVPAQKKRKVKINEKAKMMKKENTIKRERKKDSVREYLTECAATDDRFDEFFSEEKLFTVTQTHNKYEDAKSFLDMMAVRAKALNTPSTETKIDEDEPMSVPAKRRRF